MTPVSVLLLCCLSLTARIASTQGILDGAVGEYRIDFILEDRANDTEHQSIPTIVYYPALNQAGGKQVPLLVFAHGWGCAGDWYEYYAAGLVTAGYVVASIDSYRNLYDNSPDHLSEDQLYVLDAILNQSRTNASSPIFGMLNGVASAAGHSNGGAATVLSTTANKNFKAFHVLSPAMTSELQPQLVTQPAFVMTGSKDCVCPPAKNAYPIYQELGSACKYYVSLTNATHCHFMENKGPVENAGCEELLEHRCFPDHIPIHQQFALTSKYALPWFDFTLKGLSRLNLIEDMLNADQQDGLLVWEKQCTAAAADDVTSAHAPPQEHAWSADNLTFKF